MEGIYSPNVYTWILYWMYKVIGFTMIKEPTQVRQKGREINSRNIKLEQRTKDWACKRYGITKQQVMWLVNYSSNAEKNLTRIKEIVEYDGIVKKEVRSLKENIDDVINKVYHQTE